MLQALFAGLLVLFYLALVVSLAALFGRWLDRLEYHDAVRERLAGLRRVEDGW